MQQTYPNFRTLVVDNGSTDGSVEWLKEHQIDTIFLPENTGFSGAVNVGIKAADTPYVLLLNNDVRVDRVFRGGDGACDRSVGAHLFRQQPDDPDVPSGQAG